MKRALLLCVALAIVVAAVLFSTCDWRWSGYEPSDSPPSPPKIGASVTKPPARARGENPADDATQDPSGAPSPPPPPSADASRAAGVVETTFDPPDTRVATPRHALRGRVVDLRGRPVAGAKVELVSVWLPRDVLAGFEVRPSMTSRVTTGTDGTFDLPYHEGGDRELSVSCSDDRDWRGWNVGDDRDCEVVLPDGPSALIVRVTSADDGSPVPVARVAAVRTSPDGLDSGMVVDVDDLPEPGTPGAEGVFRVGGLEAGPAFLDVSAPGFAPSLARPVMVPVAGESTIDVVLKRGMTVRGQVVEAASGVGIADVCVRLGRRSERVPSDDACVEAWTDAEGQFVLEHAPLVPRTFVTFVARRFGRGDSDLADQEFLVGTADAAATEVEVVVRLRPAAGVQVRCLDAEGRAVANALVVVFSDYDETPPGGMRSWQTSTVVATTGADGRATLAGLHPGTDGIELRTRVYLDGVPVLERSFPPLRPGETRDLGDVVLAPGLTLRGVVLDADGKPVAGATVVAAAHDAADPDHAAIGDAVISHSGRRAETQPDGTFALMGLTKGLWDLYAQADMASPGRLSIGVDPNSGGVSLRLPRVVALEGRVVDAKGSPIAGAHVRAAREEFGLQTIVSCATGDDGRFSIPGFDAAAVEVDLSVKPPGGAAQKFTARPGVPSTELRLRP